MKDISKFIDTNFLERVEGGIRKKAYVPQSEGEALGKSGVTVGAGFDLGQRSNLNDIDISEELKNKLKPYLNKKKDAAIKALKEKPLTLSETEVNSLQNAVYNAYYGAAKRKFESKSKNNFEDLPREIRTALYSLHYHTGGIGPNVTDYADEAKDTGDYSNFLKEMRNYYKVNKKSDFKVKRRRKEANYVEEQKQIKDFSKEHPYLADQTENTPYDMFDETPEHEKTVFKNKNDFLLDDLEDNSKEVERLSKLKPSRPETVTPEDVLDKKIKLKEQYDSLKNPTTEVEDTEQPETEELPFYDPLPNYGKKDGGVRYEDGGVDPIDRITDFIKGTPAPNPDEEELENSEALNQKLAAQDITDNSGPIPAGVGEQNLTQNKQPVKKEEPLTMESLESRLKDLMKARKEERSTDQWLSAASNLAYLFDKASARPLGLKPTTFKSGNADAEMKDLLTLGKLKGLGTTRAMSEYERALVEDREKARTLAEKKLAAYTKEKEADRKLAEKKLALKPKTITELEKIETKAAVKDKYETKKENRELRRDAKSALEKLDEQQKIVESALNDLNSIIEKGAFGKGMVDTGPFDQYLAKNSPKGKSLERKLNKLALKEMTSMFKGMAKSIDSDAEREFFRVTQPNMGDFSSNNLQTLKDLKANIESLRAKTLKKINSYDSQGNEVQDGSTYTPTIEAKIQRVIDANPGSTREQVIEQLKKAGKL